jgi:hypothetical protein
MPAGIIATVDGGFATLDFVDRSLRGPALDTLIEAGGAGIIETITRDGPRWKYRVPVGNATAAGLLDGDEVGVVKPVVRDSGTAAALAAAHTAGIAAGAVTRPDMPTSANKYVGTTTAAAERALAPSPYSGDPSGGYGGTNASETPTHREVIDYVKENGPVLAQAMAPKAFEVNAALADIYSGDPSGAAPGTVPIEGGESLGEFTPNPVVQDVTATGGAVATVDGEQAWPEGEPSDKWLRPELNAYATHIGIVDADKLASKAEVLSAIESKLAEPK